MTRTFFQLFPEKKVSDDQICAAAVAAVLGDQKTGSRRGIDFGNDPFSSETGIRFNHRLSRTVDLVSILSIHSLKSLNLPFVTHWGLLDSEVLQPGGLSGKTCILIRTIVDETVLY